MSLPFQIKLISHCCCKIKWNLPILLIDRNAIRPLPILFPFSGKPIIEEEGRIYINRAHSLVLNTTLEEDGGKSMIATYTCLVDNGVKPVRASARLKPKAPQGPVLARLTPNKVARWSLSPSLRVKGKRKSYYCWTWNSFYIHITGLKHIKDTSHVWSPKDFSFTFCVIFLLLLEL